MSYYDGICHGFEKESVKGVVFYTIPSFSRTGLVRHCFSTRIGGVSKGCFESLCFSLSREKNPDNFRENTTRLADACGVDYDSITVVNYEHGDNIYEIGSDDAGKGLTRENDIPKCDALVCSLKGTAAMTMHADCVPLFYLSDKTGTCAVAHAGWRGVIKGLPGKIASHIASMEGCNADGLLVGIGPHIKSCCFEVGSEVRDVFLDKYGERACRESDGRLYVDLEYAIICQFREAGIPAENITVSDLCTHCNEDLFYSHRRDRGMTGAMASMIQKL